MPTNALGKWSKLMPRPSTKSNELATIDARREALRAELAQLDERAKIAELAARDAGRQVLYGALERIQIGPMDKADAKVIAAVIRDLGGKAVATKLSSPHPD